MYVYKGALEMLRVSQGWWDSNPGCRDINSPAFHYGCTSIVLYIVKIGGAKDCIRWFKVTLRVLYIESGLTITSHGPIEWYFEVMFILRTEIIKLATSR